uniref:Uncharacterized protein n=1 Tax=Ixodes ricinus TaxID=34613 RepID=A0A6B0U777_IXORI
MPVVGLASCASCYVSSNQAVAQNNRTARAMMLSGCMRVAGASWTDLGAIPVLPVPSLLLARAQHGFPGATQSCLTLANVTYAAKKKKKVSITVFICSLWIQ